VDALQKMGQTETEKRISDLIKTVYLGEISKSPQAEKIKKQLSETVIQIFQQEDKKKIMVVKVPLDVLTVVRSSQSRFTSKVRSIFPDYFVLLIRKKNIVCLSKRMRWNKKVDSSDMKRHVHEQWISDLCYPSLVECRMTEVKRGSRIEKAMVDRRSELTEDEFKLREFAFKGLTGKALRYSVRYY
jgi:hypothetical protein